MNIWLINPFSDLPNEGASEGRFCCLARMLAAQGARGVTAAMAHARLSVYGFRILIDLHKV